MYLNSCFSSVLDFFKIKINYHSKYKILIVLFEKKNIFWYYLAL